MQQGAQQAQNPQQRGGGSNWLNSIVRLMFFYMVFNYFFKSKSAVPQVDQEGKSLPVLYNIWNEGTRFELRVYLTEDLNFEEHKKSDNLIWYQKDLYYDWRESNNRETYIQYKPTEGLLNNGSLYAHVFVTKSGYPFDPSDPKYDPKASFYGVNGVTKYTLVKKTTKKNLLSGEASVPSNQIVNETEIRSYWKPNITLHLIEDQNRYSRSSIPPQLVEKMTINYDESYFYPTLYFDEFWLFKEHLMSINDTVEYLPLTISYSTMGIIKWQFMLQMEQSFKMQENMGTSTENEADEFKRMLVETNPYLLALTFVVTLMHSLFDFLAFKNDIQFWKNKKSLEGLSVKTIFINAVCQFIIFLYLIDNETSWVVIISSGIGVLIEFWKIGKAVIVEIDWTKRIPISFKDRASYASKTKEYDDQAITYLSYVAYPLVIGYGIYSLMYESHKSWYSWVLGSLTGCVYTFGFIMMTPQLFINYKLKSVAHLPWRTFTYKALNTFIDDLFAFIIKMPLMHRLSCFRDDIIFLIYLYQRWIYRIDYSRVNEFGQGGADDADDASEKKEENKSSEKTEEIEDKEETETKKEEEDKEEEKDKKQKQKKSVKTKKEEEDKEEEKDKKQKQKKSVKTKEEKKND